MAEYIKRTDAVKIAEKYGLANGSVLGRHTGLADCIARDISELPAADVVEVVRCKDCKYFGLNDENVPYCLNPFGLDDPEPNGFCNYGIGKN